jgi:Winged helix-turn helix
MSDGELGRLEVLRDLDQRRLTTAAAAQLLGLERRQVFRLLKAYRTEGPVGLISKRRGRASNRRKPEAVRREALSIIRERYWDFGPTLAAEKLREAHQIMLGRETLRRWMIEAGIWADRKQRRKQVHQPRHRRDCVGELVQIDGCEHWWFEDRGPQCTLLVFVDDATSRLMHLQFVESESTFAYFHATRAYLEAWGKPVAFYSDKHGVFRVNHPGALGGDGMTVWPGITRVEHRHHLRQYEPGQRPGRASAQDPTGPAGQGIAAGRGAHFGRRQRLASGIFR